MQEKEAYVNFVVQRARVYVRAVRTPAYGSDGASEFIHAHGVLRALVAALPHANGAVVAAGDYELDPCASCESSVEGIKDRKSTRLNSSHSGESRMPSSA